jgi:uncharacterized metal-binding protein
MKKKCLCLYRHINHLFILGGIVFGLYLSVILIKFIVIAGFITLTLIFKIERMSSSILQSVKSVNSTYYKGCNNFSLEYN